MINTEQKLGVIRHGLSFIGGVLVWDGKADQGQIEQIIGAVMMIVSIVWSVLQKKGPATAAVPMIMFGFVMVTGITGCKNIPVIPFDPIQDVVTNTVPDVVIPPVVPPVIIPDPATNAPASNLPFDPGDCEFHRIAADILDWKVTRTLTVSKFTHDKLWSSCSGKDWPERDGLQGCFGLAVEQPDGTVIVGTWDWNRSKHQPMKELKNLNPLTKEGKKSEHAFFKLYSGARIWWFCTAFSRDSKRTVKERTNFVPGVWK